MRSRVCFEAFYMDRFCLLIEYGMLTGLCSWGVSRVILLLHSVCLHQVHDQVQTIQRVGTMDSPLALCFDTLTLGHTPILSCWHWLVRMYTGSPFCLEMFWHQSLSMLYMQPGFFIQQSSSKGLESDSWIFVNSIGVHAGTHPICCLVLLLR